MCGFELKSERITRSNNPQFHKQQLSIDLLGFTWGKILKLSSLRVLMLNAKFRNSNERGGGGGAVSSYFVIQHSL